MDVDACCNEPYQVRRWGRDAGQAQPAPGPNCVFGPARPPAARIAPLLRPLLPYLKRVNNGRVIVF